MAQLKVGLCQMVAVQVGLESRPRARRLSVVIGHLVAHTAHRKNDRSGHGVVSA